MSTVKSETRYYTTQEERTDDHNLVVIEVFLWEILVELRTDEATDEAFLNYSEPSLLSSFETRPEKIHAERSNRKVFNDFKERLNRK